MKPVGACCLRAAVFWGTLSPPYPPILKLEAPPGGACRRVLLLSVQVKMECREEKRGLASEGCETFLEDYWLLEKSKSEKRSAVPIFMSTLLRLDIFLES